MTKRMHLQRISGQRGFSIVEAMVALLVLSVGMLGIAGLYVTTLRASGSGLAAAGSKIGGMLGPLLLTSTPEPSTLALVVALPVAVAALVLWFAGMETAGRALVESETG